MKHINFFLACLSAIACIVRCDAKSEIYEPCGSDRSLECVRKFFNEKSGCSVVSKENQRSFNDVPLPLYIPKANLTAVMMKVYPSDLEGVIEQFYVNKSSGNLIMALNYDKLNCDSPETILAINQKGKEPIVFIGTFNISHPPVVLTGVIPMSNEKISEDSLKKATYTAYVLDGHSKFYGGPKFSDSDDPQIAAVYEVFAKSPDYTTAETFLTSSIYFFLWYIENYVCSFDIKPDLKFDYDKTVLQRVLVNKDKDTSMPCADSDDLTECVRDYFDSKGSCSVIRQPDDEAVHRPRYEVYTRWLNMTAIVVNAEVTGLNGTIRDFYVNEQTGNLIMSVNFDGIHMNAPKVPLLIHQRGKEPKNVTDYNTDFYPVWLTAVFPMKDGITSDVMKKALVMPYFPAPTVDFDVGPRQEDSGDEELNKIIDMLAADPMTHANEMFVTESHRMFLAYFQKYICDYGLPIDPYF